jgi:tetratricopeptide (TPR) repeat protein
LRRERIAFAGATIAFLVAAGCLAASYASPGSADKSVKPESAALAKITVDYPRTGSIFPPEIIAPVFRWRDASTDAKSWRVDVTFAGHGGHINDKTDGPPLQIGEIDQRVVMENNRPPTLTPEEAEGHTWTPDEKTWTKIKKNSTGGAATVTITGFADEKQKHPLSRGEVTIETSRDPVGAPIFYRDVPLIPSEGKKGIISPIPKHMLGVVAWRLRDISQPQSHLLMTGSSTCVNCHSFSRDGKTMGLDVDGPDNDRGLYSLMTIKPQTTMNDASIVKWSTFEGPLGGNLRIGFMSQVSPDGNYVLTTINDPRSQMSANHRSDIADRYYVMNFKDYRFLQVFYPTRGILAWYSRESGRLQPLPGADDDKFVQAGAVWSPDGKYIVFLRAEARTAYPPGHANAEYATDPKETQIQYDLYRIPFNDGKGGTPERIEGASQNGMSNSFPKVSPDGKWIVFVEAHNGLLMRPDSKLFIVPFEGGQARPLNSNLATMNSWHSFSPNGRWLVFSSKARSPYTQMYLTHFDENGDSSPAILIDNSTSANRAVNLPEFVNIPQNYWDKLEAPLASFFHEFDTAADLRREGKLDDAITHYHKALVLSPGDAKTYFELGEALEQKGNVAEAVGQYKAALNADPTSSRNEAVYADLGYALARTGKLEDAIASFNKALDATPGDPRAHAGLGAAMLDEGRLDESISHCQKALDADPDSAPAHNTMGAALARNGDLNGGAEHLEKAVELTPECFECQFNLGRVMAAQSRFNDALPHFEKAAEISGGKDAQSLWFTALMFSETGQPAQAVTAAQRALTVAQQAGDSEMQQTIREKIAEWQRIAQGEEAR